MNIKSILVGLLLLPQVIFAGSSFDLDIFTSNGAYSQDGSASFQVDVQDAGSDWVTMSIMNQSDIYSVISSIYFSDTRNIMDINSFSVINNDDVAFTINTTPSYLPAGEELDPDFVTTYSFTANPPPARNGIEPMEQVMFTVHITGGYEQFIDSLQSGDTRIAAHVIAFPDGSSESAVIRVVPEPGSIMLIFLGITCLWSTRKVRVPGEIQK